MGVPLPPHTRGCSRSAPIGSQARHFPHLGWGKLICRNAKASPVRHGGGEPRSGGRGALNAHTNRGAVARRQICLRTAALFSWKRIIFVKAQQKRQDPLKQGRGTRAIPVFALVLLPLFVFLSRVLSSFLERNKMTPHRVPLYLFVQPQDIVRKCQQNCFS